MKVQLEFKIQDCWIGELWWDKMIIEALGMSNPQKSMEDNCCKITLTADQTDDFWLLAKLYWALKDGTLKEWLDRTDTKQPPR